MLLNISAALPTGTSGTRPVIGFPDFVPDLTFITGPIGSDPFLVLANNYHTVFNLVPSVISSFEDLLGQIQNYTGDINRIRIISHANHDNLFTPFFENDRRGVLVHQLEGFGESNVEGLKELFRKSSSSGNEHLHSANAGDLILSLRNAGSTALIPFGLDNASHIATGDEDDFILRAFDLFIIDNAATTVLIFNNDGVQTGTRNVTNPEKTALRTAVNFILDDMISNWSDTSVNSTQLEALRDAIAGFTFTGWSYNRPESLFEHITSANTGISNGIQAKIAAVRAKLGSSDKFIDIRGCNVGQNAGYMDAVRDFFGTTTAMPVVSAPVWYQEFSTSTFSPFTSQAHIAGFISSGRDGITNTDVQEALATWGDLIQFDDHFSYFRSLFMGSKIDFVSLSWKKWKDTSHPNAFPILNMEAKYIEEIVNDVSLTISQTIDSITSLLGVNSSNAPSTTQRNTLNAIQNHVDQIRLKKLIFDITPGSPTSGWTSFYQELIQLESNLTGTANMPAPGSTPIIAANANPSRGDTDTALTNLITYVTNTLNTFLTNYFTSVLAIVTNDTSGKLTYWYRIGLPLLVQHLSGATPQKDYYLTLWGTNAQKTAAMKSLLKIQWQGEPAQLTAIHSHIDSLSMNLTNSADINQNTVSMRVVENSSGASDSGTHPLERFRDRIISIP